MIKFTPIDNVNRQFASNTLQYFFPFRNYKVRVQN